MISGLRRWARRHTDRGRYTPVGIAFHWVMAFLVLFQLGWGFYIGTMGVGGDKLAAYQVHGAVGLPILLLALGRLAWRLVIPGPHNAADEQGALTFVSRLVHWLFYAAFFGLPLSGWLMWSALEPPGTLRLAGLLPWPPLPVHDLDLVTRMALMQIAEDAHHLLAWMLLFTVPLHVGAALKHHFWDRDEVLRAMVPEVPDEEPGQAGPRHSGPARSLHPQTGAG